MQWRAPVALLRPMPLAQSCHTSHILLAVAVPMSKDPAVAPVDTLKALVLHACRALLCAGLQFIALAGMHRRQSACALASRLDSSSRPQGQAAASVYHTEPCLNACFVLGPAA